MARDSQYVSIGEEARPFLYQPLARVRSRARELAIRLAIGAAPRDVALLVVRQALTWTGVGTALGLAVAFGLTRFLASLLYGVNPADPWTFGGVALLIALVACAAALVSKGRWPVLAAKMHGEERPRKTRAPATGRLSGPGDVPPRWTGT